MTPATWSGAPIDIIYVDKRITQIINEDVDVGYVRRKRFGEYGNAKDIAFSKQMRDHSAQLNSTQLNCQLSWFDLSLAL